jgi:sigma-E factor negative regulatory protein RseB
MKWLQLFLLISSLVCSRTQAQIVSGTEETALAAWLQKVNDASRHRAYTGTFVVSAGDAMSSAKIWHVCDGAQQMERIETLSGIAKATFRHNDQVVTFYPDDKVVLAENRASLSSFPYLFKPPQTSLEESYQIRVLPGDRVVGLDTDVVQLKPKDTARFGYRVWTEKKSGLVLRLQVLDADGRVLEQSAFSELQLDAPVSMAKLSAMMANTAGYRVERPDLHKTTALEQGWILRANTSGFQPTGCVRRILVTPQSSHVPSGAITHCMFSDGLANLSLFMEPYNARRNTRESSSEVSGATHTLTVRSGEWWITAVGEVPLRTLQSFALGLERKK